MAAAADLCSPLVRLQRAIFEGRCEEAAALAYKLALDRTPLYISDPRDEVEIEPIPLEIVVEQNSKHIRTLNVDVLPSDTLLDLKIQIHQTFNYPRGCQQWIINNKLIKKEGSTFADLGISSNKRSDVFLYIIEPRKFPANTSVRAPANANNHYAYEGLENAQKKPKFEPGWTCPRCTLVNEPTRPGCEACSEYRPETYVVPPNYVRTASEIERLRKEEASEQAMRQADQNKRDSAMAQYVHYLEMDNLGVFLNEVPFECPVCFEEVPPGGGITLHDCGHAFCTVCLRAQIENCEDAAVGCPGENCPSFMLDREIKHLVAADVYQRYLQRSMTIAEVTIKNSYHCKTPDCRGWCIVEAGGGNRFLCPICAATNCTDCGVIHANQSCREYQDDLLRPARIEAETKLTGSQIEELIRKNEAVYCTGCGVVIMKTSGCPHVVCTYCKHDTRYENLKNTG